MLEALALHEAGHEFTREELDARIANGPGKGTAQRIGSVAIIPIYGVIFPRADLFAEISGGTSLETFRSTLDEAVRDPDVKAIALDVNSPGGSTELLEETAAEIREARDTKPVVAVANTLMASAAYHLASQASEIFATPSGHVGAIGVYSAHTDVSKAEEKAGIKTTLIYAGKYKVEGNPYESLSASARRHMQELVDASYDVFVSDIALGRNVAEGIVRDGYGEGRVLDARRAASEGMVDGVQTFDATLSALLASGDSGRVGSAGTQALIDQTIAAAEGVQANGNFSDAVDEALRAIDAVVTDSEALRALSRRKREKLEALKSRLEGLVATAPDEPANDLEVEGTIAEASARLLRIA